MMGGGIKAALGQGAYKQRPPSRLADLSVTETSFAVHIGTIIYSQFCYRL